MNDRKIRIEVGRGLEGVLTDIQSGWIIDKVMQPAFKKKKYYQGTDEAIDKIFLAIAGEFSAEDAENASKGDAALVFYGILLVITGLLGFVHFIVGGIIGAIGAPILTNWLFSPGAGWLVLAALIGFALGSISKFIIEIWAESGGGIGGGSGGRGGFGGGGGGFGGGGASGGW